MFLLGRRVNSPNRDADLNIDIALDRIRVGTNGVSALDKLSRRLLVYAGDGHGECGGQHESIRGVAIEADLGDNFDVASANRRPALRLTCNSAFSKQAA